MPNNSNNTFNLSSITLIKSILPQQFVTCLGCHSRKLGLANKEKVQLNKKKEGKSCIKGAKKCVA